MYPLPLVYYTILISIFRRDKKKINVLGRLFTYLKPIIRRRELMALLS
jgi:hypothetical protein